MHQEIAVELRFSSGAKRDLSPLVAKTLKSFFKDGGEELGPIKFIGCAVDSSGDAQKMIKHQPGLPNKANMKGVPVSVWIEGRQGVRGFLSVEQADKYDVLKGIILEGKLKKVRPVVTQVAPLEVSSLKNKETAVITPPAEQTPSTVKVAAAKDMSVLKIFSKLSPREKLEGAGVSLEEIERLKATLASIIIQANQGLATIPNLLRVSVKTITEAILGHMRLNPGSNDTYRGIIGSFYSTRIALFGLKYDEEQSVNSDSKYSDWLLDCMLVIDFIGGKDKLPCLSRVREEEISERLKISRESREPAPTANKVEEAMQDGFIADGKVLTLVSHMLLGKREAEGNLQSAQANEVALQLEVERLKKLLTGATKALSDAVVLRKQAESNLAQYVLSDEILQKIREAKIRFETLMGDLGI